MSVKLKVPERVCQDLLLVLGYLKSAEVFLFKHIGEYEGLKNTKAPERVKLAAFEVIRAREQIYRRMIYFEDDDDNDNAGNDEV